MILQGICVRFDWLSALSRPLDLGFRYRGHRLFGGNKTFRGLACAMIGSALAVVLQAVVLHDFPWFVSLEYFDYSAIHPFRFGLLLGLAATLSELPNSFVKRQLGIAEGRLGTQHRFVFFFLDQADFLAGTWLVLATVMEVTAWRVLGSIAVALVAHPLITLIGYVLQMRKTLR